MSLAHGWKAFARARGLSERCTLHFKYDRLATLYVRVFGEDGRRAGCCPEDISDDDELALDDVHAHSNSDVSSSGGVSATAAMLSCHAAMPGLERVMRSLAVVPQ